MHIQLTDFGSGVIIDNNECLYIAKEINYNNMYLII